MQPYAVELRGITKRFPGVLANDRIDLAVEKGEIRAIVGENGAGKTTLMRILYGLYRPDGGQILVKGKVASFGSPQEAIRAGLGMVHQQFMLFPSLTVTENVIFGAEVTTHGFIDFERAARTVERLAETHGLQVDARATVGDLPVGVRQRVEILKTLYRQAKILILDEPTAVLTPRETEFIFQILQRLAGQGKSILFITHKLNEVMRLSDKATVLRNGRVAATLPTATSSPEEISRHMVGRDVLLHVEKQPASRSDTVLQVKGLTLLNRDGRPVVRDLDFTVEAGEIVGIAGVAGNGQTELIEAIAGLRPTNRGTIRLQGQELGPLSVRQRREAGLAYIPEDRVERGLAVDASVAENLMIGYQQQGRFSQRGLLQPQGIRTHAARLIERFAIKVANQTERAANLSGGNLQKMVVARELSHQAPLLIAEQPTRGVDVGSIEYIHNRLVDYRDSGHAILLVSADLHEIRSLADRILVMYEGRVVGELAAGEATEAKLGLLMAGGRADTDTERAEADSQG